MKRLPPVKAVTLGYVQNCAISIKRQVWCWGENPAGELGFGDTKTRPDPAMVKLPADVKSVSAGVNNTCVAFEDGRVACWGTDNQMNVGGRPFVFGSKAPVWIKPARNVIKVANGRNFACGLQRDGKVICWGTIEKGLSDTEETFSGPVRYLVK